MWDSEKINHSKTKPDSTTQTPRDSPQAPPAHVAHSFAWHQLCFSATLQESPSCALPVERCFNKTEHEEVEETEAPGNRFNFPKEARSANSYLQTEVTRSQNKKLCQVKEDTEFIREIPQKSRRGIPNGTRAWCPSDKSEGPKLFPENETTNEKVTRF